MDGSAIVALVKAPLWLVFVLFELVVVFVFLLVLLELVLVSAIIDLLAPLSDVRVVYALAALGCLLVAAALFLRIASQHRGSRGWLYAAAAYNLCWGVGAVVLAPELGWKVVGMLVAVYAPAYWWAGRFPDRHAHLVAIGLLGKSLGLAGFACGWALGVVPLSFGLVVLGNDAIWWPALARFVQSAAREAGGWRAFASGAAG